jgi:hypothetical protein
VPERFPQRAGALIPESTARRLLDSRHFIPLNSPEIVASELRRFFERATREAGEIPGSSVTALTAATA